MSSIIDLSQRNDAYGGAVPHGIHGLYSSLAASATILRIAHAMGELDASVAKQDGENPKSGNKLLEDFFYQLDEMEREWNSPRRPLPPNPPCYHVVNGSDNKPRIQSYIVVVEGLDGSGKSSLVQNLVGALNETEASNPNTPNVQAMSMATPTQSMSNVRPVFDKRGGPVARAFYAVSNYMLQYEIQQLERQLGETANHDTILVAIVDRWYTSTVAYSVAWKNTNGDEQSIDELDSSIFAWPKDLRRPNMLFLLQVDDQVRRERVNHRNRKNAVEEEESSTKNSFNPWDRRLDQDENLGQRIMRSFERVAESFSSDERDQTTKVIRLDANQSQDKVLIDADRAVQEQLLDLASFRILRNPLQQFDRDPLRFFTLVSSEMKLCHPSTGKRLKHAPWAMQVAWDNLGREEASKESHIVIPPVLKTVGIHTVDRSGILFFMRNPFSIHEETNCASIVWVGGEYPYEQQWRAEGFIVRIGAQQCEILDFQPPPSLIAYTVACRQTEKEEKSNVDEIATAVAVQERLVETAVAYRQDLASIQDEQLQAVHGFRFVPMRMEVLMGGPSSPGGPRRYEWTREWKENWSSARLISPFRGANLITQQRFPAILKPITVGISGTHCAGKATIGRLIAELFDPWSPFDMELGEILRNQEVLADSGHRMGDGSGDSNASLWDDRVHQAEVNRDVQCTENGQNRIVETWHIGNLAWAMLRAENKKASQEDKNKLIARAKNAIRQHMNDRVVLLVHLTISPGDTVRRRRKNDKIKLRLPMGDEEKECTELHQYLDVHTQEYLREFQSELNVPVLQVDNSNDDDMKATLRTIVEFVNNQQWRRTMP